MKDIENEIVEIGERTVIDLGIHGVHPELIRMVGTGRVDQHSAQAAIWQRTDNMSWQQLATKSNRTISGTQQYFHPNNITIAQRLMATAEGSVREAENETGKTTEAENTAPRVR